MAASLFETWAIEALKLFPLVVFLAVAWWVQLKQLARCHERMQEALDKLIEKICED